MNSSYDTIHHYTSINTLELILCSRKIRFTRLDQVDDAREAPTASGIEFNKYFFVSCWTHVQDESIPQWHMYSKSMRGVRITLPIYPFCSKRFTPPPSWKEVTSSGNIRAPLSIEESFGDRGWVMPFFFSRDVFAGPVEYVDDVQSRYESAVTVGRDDTSESISIQHPELLVRVKPRDWEFQSEYRFSLMIFPPLPVPTEGFMAENYYMRLPVHIGNCLRSRVAPPVTHFDVDLRKSALAELLVTLGPHCTDGDAARVEEILKKFAPLGRSERSRLTGLVRAR